MSETYDSSWHFLHTKAKIFRKSELVRNIDLCLNNEINLDKLFNTFFFFLFQSFIKCWPTGNQSFASRWRPRPNSWWRFSKDAQRMGKPYWFSSSNWFFFLIIFKNNGILLPKLFWPTVRKNYSSDWEKLLKFEAEGRGFAKFWRSLEQLIWWIRTIKIKIGKNYWDWETCRKS